MEVYKLNNYAPGLWIDDVRTPHPDFWYKGKQVAWHWVKTVDTAKYYIEKAEKDKIPFAVISIDHDAGDFGTPDYIKVLDWLEATGRNYPIRLHSMNPVGIQNMRAIINKNGWKEVF